uniref:Small ribosomal subunit protein uS11c n=1 Tax=Karenia mikimotoi TaxID=225107 RepID=A0A0U1WP98_KARMI|nr:ribosomal protein S11 [Karenia mikimotoi]
MQELQLIFPRYLIKTNFTLKNKLVHLEMKERRRRKRKKIKSSEEIKIGKDFGRRLGSEKVGKRHKRRSPKRTRRGRKKRLRGQIHILANFSNTIATLTDLKGNVLRWASGGSLGFKNTKKKTPIAARAVVRKLIEETRTMFNITEVQVTVAGAGWGRTYAVWALAKSRVRISRIRCTNSIPYNGCRPRKRRKLRRRTKRKAPATGPFRPLRNNLCKLFLKRGGILKRFLINKKRRRARRRQHS